MWFRRDGLGREPAIRSMTAHLTKEKWAAFHPDCSVVVFLRSSSRVIG